MTRAAVLAMVVACMACVTAETRARREAARSRVARLSETEDRTALEAAERELAEAKTESRIERVESGAGAIEVGSRAAYPLLLMFYPQYAPAAAAAGLAAGTLRDHLRKRREEAP